MFEKLGKSDKLILPLFSSSLHPNMKLKELDANWMEGQETTIYS